MQIDVVIVWGWDDETFWFELLNYVNCVDRASVSYDEVLFNEKILRFLITQIDFWKVPHFDLAWSITGHQSVICLIDRHRC